MKQLTCEICGGTDFIKQNGVFVCQSCGCKYSAEEAKRMTSERAVGEAARLERISKGETDAIAAEKVKAKRIKILKIAIPVACICIAFAVVLATVIIPKGTMASIKKQLNSAEVGDTIKFGSYEQDNDMSNGKEDIEWLVLEKQQNKVLVISKYGLDCKKYNEFQISTTWENCTLRSWLNDEFMETAFNKYEQELVMNTVLENADNSEYEIDGGRNTVDKVFLLSIDEAERYFPAYDAMKCTPTEYAVAQGVDAEDNVVRWWWLRSPGLYGAAGVGSLGGVATHGDFVDGDGDTVRPALWLSIE